MAKINVVPITGAQNLSAINSNFEKIATELNEKVLYRKVPALEPNQIENNLDANGKRIYNLPEPVLDHEAATLGTLKDIIVGGAYRRTLRTPETIVELPKASERAGKILSFDSNGQPTVRFPSSDSAAQLRIDLAEADGGSLVGFQLNSITGAARNLYARGLDWVSILDFKGVLGNGVNDDSDGFILAANSGRKVYIPGGRIYRITKEILFQTPGVQFFGEGIENSIIKSDALNQNIFKVVANQVVLSGMSLDYNGTPVEGAGAIVYEGESPTNRVSNGEIRSLRVNRAYHAVLLKSAISIAVKDVRLYNFVASGLYLEDVGDIFFTEFVVDAITKTNGSLGCIYMRNFCEAVVISNGDVLNGKYSLATDANEMIQGQIPAHCRFTNIYLDGADNGSFLNRIATSVFTGVWFSGGRSGTGNPGCNLSIANGVTFSACQFVNSGSHGLLVSNLAERTSVLGCQFLSNSVTSGSGVAHGLVISDGARDVTVVGNTARNTYFEGVQQYGIVIGNNCVQVLVTSNSVQGNNAAKGILLGSNAFRCVIKDNIGYNSVGGKSITVSASPFNYTAGPSPETLYISGGSVSSVITSGVAVFSSTDKTLNLAPNEGVQITYSSAPFLNAVVH